VTTIAGLTPMLMETSFQAQFLVPLAATLVFGLLVATGLVLILIPTYYALYWRITHLGSVDDEKHVTIDSELIEDAPVPEPVFVTPERVNVAS
jgi:hypothetical protein